MHCFPFLIVFNFKYCLCVCIYILPILHLMHTRVDKMLRVGAMLNTLEELQMIMVIITQQLLPRLNVTITSSSSSSSSSTSSTDSSLFLVFFWSLIIHLLSVVFNDTLPEKDVIICGYNITMLCAITCYLYVALTTCLCVYTVLTDLLLKLVRINIMYMNLCKHEERFTSEQWKHFFFLCIVFCFSLAIDDILLGMVVILFFIMLDIIH